MSYFLYRGQLARELKRYCAPSNQDKDIDAGVLIDVGGKKLTVLQSELTPYEVAIHTETSPTTGSSKEISTATIFINQLSESDWEPLVAISTVGKVSANKLLSRRNQQPGKRYVDLQHMKEVNQDLSYLDWTVIGLLISFE
jgi:DNA uptake protein ComE-like DNA-binding protein